MDDLYEVKFIPEDCCDYCEEICHNHFHCPICDDSYAGTNMFFSISEEFSCFSNTGGLIFECEECNAEFKLEKENFSYHDVSVVEHLLR